MFVDDFSPIPVTVCVKLTACCTLQFTSFFASESLAHVPGHVASQARSLSKGSKITRVTVTLVTILRREGACRSFPLPSYFYHRG